MERPSWKFFEEDKNIFPFRQYTVSPIDIKKVFDTDPNYKNYKIVCIVEKLKISQEESLKIKKEKIDDNSFTINKEASG